MNQYLTGALFLSLYLSWSNCLFEWNSTEVFWITYQNRTNPTPKTPPPWLKVFRMKRKPSGKRTHRHGYMDADGIHHAVTYSNFLNYPLLYYHTGWEPMNFDVPQRRWVGGKHATPPWRHKERKYYYINYTATSKSVWVTRSGQPDVYNFWLRDYRGDWSWNDSMIFAYTNDTAKKIMGPAMTRKMRQRGSIPGRFEVHKLNPSRAWWHGLRRNRGRRLHEVVS